MRMKLEIVLTFNSVSAVDGTFDVRSQQAYTTERTALSLALDSLPGTFRTQEYGSSTAPSHADQMNLAIVKLDCRSDDLVV